MTKTSRPLAWLAVRRSTQQGRPSIARYDINPLWRWLDTIHLDSGRYSALMRAVDEACLDGDAEFLAQFRWISNLVTERHGRLTITADMKREVIARDGGRCVDCGSADRLEFDHVTPVAHGGKTTVANLALRCRACNRKKGPQAYARRRLAGAANG